MEANISLHVVYNRSGMIIALAPVGERSVSSSGVRFRVRLRIGGSSRLP
jgi:hypothetical protein